MLEFVQLRGWRTYIS